MKEQKPTVRYTGTRRMVLTGLFFAAALILSLVENTLPSPGIPGVKYGLSNIAVMYALFFLGAGPAYSIVALKAGFAAMTAGPVAGFLSLCGGLLSITVMLALLRIFKERVSYLILSVAGAVTHNIGQLAAVSWIYTSLYLWASLPVLLIAGIAAGTLTSALLRVILPAFRRLGLK